MQGTRCRGLILASKLAVIDVEVAETVAIFLAWDTCGIVAFLITVITGDLTEVRFCQLQLWPFFFSAGVVFVPEAGVLPSRCSYLSLRFFFFSFLVFSDFSDFSGLSGFSAPCSAWELAFSLA